MSNQTYTSMYSRNAELYHHGIKGQKWGVRNGPPYPLGSGKSGGKKVTRKTSPNRVEKSETNKSQISSEKVKSFINKNFSDKVKSRDQVKGSEQDAIAELVGVGVAILLGIGFTKISNVIVEKALKEQIQRESAENKRDQQGSFKKKTKNSTIEADVRACNPHLDEDPKWQSNCVLASVTYDMRRRGYDVTANPSRIGRTIEDTSKMYNIPVNQVNKARSYKSLNTQLSEMPDGSRGILHTNVGTMVSSRHAVVWEKQKGNVKIIDPQRNIIYNSLEDAKKAGYLSTDLGQYKHEFIRTDDKDINKEAIKDACRNRTK